MNSSERLTAPLHKRVELPVNSAIELHGAYIVRSEPTSWQLVESCISKDGERLAEIFRVDGSGCRVLRLKKVSGAPQWKGLWWSEAEASSITHNIDDARRLALAYMEH